MKLPSIKKLLLEEIDLKTVWLPNLLAPINVFFESVYNALNKGITVTDNMDGEIKTISLDGTFPYNLKWERKNPPKAAWIVFSDTAPSGGMSLHWEFTSTGMFSIKSIQGLSPSSASKVTIRVIIICN